MKQIDMPDHAKKKLINFFVKNSLPRILERERKKRLKHVREKENERSRLECLRR